MLLNLGIRLGIALSCAIALKRRLYHLGVLATTVSLIVSATDLSFAEDALGERLNFIRAFSSLRLAGAQAIESVTRGMDCKDAGLEKAMRSAAREFVTHAKGEVEELGKSSPDLQKMHEHLRRSLKANEQVVVMMERCIANLSRRGAS